MDHLDKLLSKFERSAVVLQSLIRGWQARRAVAKRKNQQRRNQAAILIQAGKHNKNVAQVSVLLCEGRCAVVRGWVSRIHVRRQRRERTNAAIAIQAGQLECMSLCDYMLLR